MTNLDFLLKCGGLNEVTVVNNANGNIIVRGIYYGPEDLSWYEYEYIFDQDGNYVSDRMTDQH